MQVRVRKTNGFVVRENEKLTLALARAVRIINKDIAEVNFCEVSNFEYLVIERLPEVKQSA